MKRRTAVILKWVGIVIVVLGFAYGALDFASRRALKREYDALRADGRPMELREIVPPAIPDGDNAALVYKAAIQMLKAEPPVTLESYTPPSGHVIGNLFVQLGYVASATLESSTNTVAAEDIARLLNHPRVVEFLTAIERGSERPGYRQELDYSQGAGILMPHIGENRNISRILSVTARRQAAAGKTDDAWHTAMLGIRFADSLRTEPILISQLVRVAQLAIAMKALRTVAEVAPPSADDCANLETLLASFESREPLVLSLNGEMLILGEWAFRVRPSDFANLGDTAKFLLTVESIFGPARRFDHAVYLRVMRGYANNAARSFAPGDSGFDSRMLNAVPFPGLYHTASESWTEQHVPWCCIVTRMMTPGLSATKAKFTAMIAQARVTRAGLAAIRFKQEHGAFPSDLQALELANADDPFTGKPLIYSTTDRGFTIHSVGINLVDDGGTKGKDSKSGDEVWRYEERNPAEQIKD